MPRPYTRNLPLHARLTPTGIAILEREKARRDLPSLSAVPDEALRQLIEATDAGRKGLLIVPIEETIIKRSYLVSPEVHALLKARTSVLISSRSCALRSPRWIGISGHPARRPWNSGSA